MVSLSVGSLFVAGLVAELVDGPVLAIEPEQLVAAAAAVAVAVAAAVGLDCLGDVVVIAIAVVLAVIAFVVPLLLVSEQFDYLSMLLEPEPDQQHAAE